MTVRKLTLSAAATTSVLILCGAVLTGAAASPAAADTPTTATATAAPAPSGDPSGDPSASSATLAPPASGTTPATVATPAQGSAPATAADAPGLALSAYDAATGTAVLAPATTGPRSLSAQAAPADGPSADAASAVKPGQLIDSPPTPAAPHGALVAVTGVQPTADGKVAVTTRPATLPELLGGTSASLRSAVSPGSFEVHPQLGGVQVTTDLGATAGQGSVSGSLGLSADANVPLPDGSSLKLSGSVSLRPAIDFSYQGGAGLIDPQQARIGFTLGAHADWRVSAGLTGSTTPIRIPLATYSASPVVMVGALPVVINLAFTLSADVSADGTVTIDAEQAYDGQWGVHSDYVKGPGWTTTTDPGSSTVSPLHLDLRGSASARAGLLAEGSIALYDTVGVKASIEPYLRAAVNGSVVLDGTGGGSGTGAGSGSGPAVNGTAALYGGLDINGALMARLAILGTPILSADLPFLAFHREWPLTSVSVGQPPAPLVNWPALSAGLFDDNRSAYLKTRPDWDPRALKASCPDGTRLIGLSHGGDNGLCTDVTRANPWDADHTYVVDHGGTYVSTDWAPGYAKAQCPAGSVLTGYSRNGRTMGALCAKSTAPLGTSTRTLWFDKGDNRPAGAAGGDFSYGFAKGQCADDEVAAGLAYTQPWWQLWAARPYALLCQKLA
ncbi:hypothetical protein VM98_29945 [Streptomyces rubellomurinus subsp. indigoferus]|nr:hypothetical protein VM98_29945 [Streptomyces rubellomurinus subsp. indigoferus]